MIPIKTESAWKGTSDCRACGIREMVLFADLNEEDFKMIHAPVDDLEFALGTALFHEGESALGIFTLRKGILKLVRSTPDGRQRIVRVLRPGDVAGLSALATARYDCDAVALTDVSVCRVPLAVIHTLQAQSPRLHQKLMEKWSGALKNADDWVVDINFGSARNRVSNFVLKMRDDVDQSLVTLFAREDMGAMMDLKMETVSREISALVREGVLEPQDKHGRLYRIVRLDALKATV
ncbi:MAG: Crp/Fnr family transcriptional regulator [Rhodoferax sp.]|nr:Crp/Fnr family transcriptional regulator [Rhodoferax sp.]